MRGRRAILAGLGTALGAALMPPRQALAHARLDRAEPGAGTRGAAPIEVVLRFTEAVEPRFSSIVVVNGAGTRWEAGPAQIGGDTHTLRVSLKPLPPGDYRVDWVVVSVDTHRSQGSYGFTVVA